MKLTMNVKLPSCFKNVAAGNDRIFCTTFQIFTFIIFARDKSQRTGCRISVH